MPLWGWVVIGLLLGLIGALLALVATRASAVRAAPGGDGGFENPVVAVGPNVPTGLPGTTTPAGWHPVRGDPLEQMYWDGTTWTARTRWDGARWVDIGRPGEAPAAAVSENSMAPPPPSKLARFFMR
jgi:hypothetical protein